jgi:hypothetical protein
MGVHVALPNPSLAGRNGRIWKEYCRGATQAELAEKYNLSQARISQIIIECRDAIPFEERDNLVKQETDLLRELRKEVLELWDAAAAPLIHGPRAEIVRDEHDNVVRDHSGRLAALARAESITSRLHRVLGLDAPQKVDLSLAGEEEATRKAAADAITRLHGGTEE